MNGIHPPLNNKDYFDHYGQATLKYPNWWHTHGGQLIPLESGIGTRVWLTNFTPLIRDLLERCLFHKDDEPLADFDPSRYSWHYWVYGPFGSVDPVACKEMEINEWLFYSIATGALPLPVIREADPIGDRVINEFREGAACAYITREITQKMVIGMFYLLVVVVNGVAGQDTMTPLDMISKRPKLPATWLIVQDTQRNFHSRHEDIQTQRRTLCP